DFIISIKDTILSIVQIWSLIPAAIAGNPPLK
ncbi:unnamed protein product, partial [marine sediment metagenome]